MRSLILVCAGAVAGLIGTAGGITSLISYPALLAVGLPALPANVANNVATVGLWPGSAFGSRPELRGRGLWLRRWLPIALLGGGLGAALLLLTPPRVFVRVVPCLVLVASLALLAEPRLTAWYRGRPARSEPRTELALGVGILTLGVYGGYFGAGSGVMVLTLLLLVTERHLPTANALKNMLVGGMSACTAVVFTLFAGVDWTAVVPLMAGMLAGSRVGPLVTRRVPAGLMRLLIACVGLILAAELWFNPRF